MTNHDRVDAPASRPACVSELPSIWRPLKAVQKRMDDGIADAYLALGIEGVRPRFSEALMFLEDQSLSIRELAERCEVTHSAMSQSVAAMRDAGLVTSEPGADARSRVVTLTDRGRWAAPQLWAEWYATEAAAHELADEAGVDLDGAVALMQAALDRESFTDRVLRHMRGGAVRGGPNGGENE